MTDHQLDCLSHPHLLWWCFSSQILHLSCLYFPSWIPGLLLVPISTALPKSIIFALQTFFKLMLSSSSQIALYQMWTLDPGHTGSYIPGLCVKGESFQQPLQRRRVTVASWFKSDIILESAQHPQSVFRRSCLDSNRWQQIAPLAGVLMVSLCDFMVQNVLDWTSWHLFKSFCERWDWSFGFRVSVTRLI